MQNYQSWLKIRSNTIDEGFMDWLSGNKKQQPKVNKKQAYDEAYAKIQQNPEFRNQVNGLARNLRLNQNIIASHHGLVDALKLFVARVMYNGQEETKGIGRLDWHEMGTIWNAITEPINVPQPQQGQQGQGQQPQQVVIADQLRIDNPWKLIYMIPGYVDAIEFDVNNSIDGQIADAAKQYAYDKYYRQNPQQQQQQTTKKTKQNKNQAPMNNAQPVGAPPLVASNQQHINDLLDLLRSAKRNRNRNLVIKIQDRLMRAGYTGNNP